MSENHFAKALRNFTMDAAAGDAIRYLTDKGYSPAQIKETITYPAPMEYVYSVMWERLVATGKIIPAKKVSEGTVLFDTFFQNNSQRGQSGDGSVIDCTSSIAEPSPDRAANYEIIEHRDRYGRKSFVQVKKESPEEMIFSPEDYVQIDSLLVHKSIAEWFSLFPVQEFLS